MSESMAEALAELRRFDYERIYLRPASLEQSRRVVDMLEALVEHYLVRPAELPDGYMILPGRRHRCRAGGELRGRDDRPLRLRPSGGPA